MTTQIVINENNKNVLKYGSSGKSKTKEYADIFKFLIKKGILTIKELNNAVQDTQDELSDEINEKLNIYADDLVARLK